MSSVSGLFTVRICPTCASTELDSAWRIGSEPPGETMSFAELQDSWHGFFKNRKLFFTYRRCASCGLVYSPVYFTAEQLAELYRRMDDNTAGVSAGVLTKTQRGYFNLLRSLAAIPAGGGYLELGPDIGSFTREAMGAIDFAHYWMVEPNLEVHGALGELLRGREYSLLSDDSQLEEVPDKSISAVVAIHVIDHLRDPRARLEQLHRKLKHGGVIFLVLHNQQSIIARFFGRRWPPYCLQHPQIFAPSSVTDILERAGFQVVQVRATVNHFPIMYLLRHFLFGVGIGRVPLPELAWWTVGLKLQNIAVAGRKL